MELNEIHNPETEHAAVSLKVILLIFAIVLVGVLGYLVWDYQTAPDTADYSVPKLTKQTDSTPAAETETEADETAEWKTYSNTEFGFGLTFNEKWEGYKVKEVKRTENTKSIYFTMPLSGHAASEANAADYYPVLTIAVYTEEQYDALAGTNRGVKIAASDNYVFSYYGSQETIDALKAVQDDIANIVGTFKLTD